MRTAETDNLATLVCASAAGDAQAWNELVRRYAGLVVTITRHYQLSAADAEDVTQTVWLRLVEHVARLREPAALPGWLVTTTQRECRRYVWHKGRSTSVDPLDLTQLTATDSLPIDGDLLAAERHQVLLDGLAELPHQHRQLLMLLAADPPHTYVEISRILDISIGSIGPTRSRALEKLRATNAVQTYIQAINAAPRVGGSRHALDELE